MTVCGLNLAAVTRLVADWQIRLQLFEWEIVVLLVGAAEIGKDKAGECDHDSHRHTATIRINVDAHEEDGMAELLDTIIHELLHLQFWWLPAEGVQSTLLEQSFHRICPVLASLPPAKKLAKRLR